MYSLRSDAVVGLDRVEELQLLGGGAARAPPHDGVSALPTLLSLVPLTRSGAVLSVPFDLSSILVEAHLQTLKGEATDRPYGPTPHPSALTRRFPTHPLTLERFASSAASSGAFEGG
jgi:hypothetical protein